MIAILFFGAIAVLLFYWLVRLKYYGGITHRSASPTARAINGTRHEGYAWKLFGLAIVASVAMPFVALVLRGEANNPPPQELLRVSRWLAIALLTILAVIFLGVHGFKEGRERIHRVLGWISIALFLALAAVGGVEYFRTYR